MNVHNPAQSFLRPMVNTRFKQQFCRQKTLTVDKVLWLSVGKVLVVLCPLVLVMNLWLASSLRNLDVSVKEVENLRLELMDKQIKLRAQRAQLFSPEQIQAIAAQKFSLHVPEKDQVKLF